MLQNATTIEQFKVYLENTVILFSSRYVHDRYNDALTTMSTEITARNMITKIEVENNFNTSNVEFRKENRMFVFPAGENIYNVLKNESPFKLHFMPVIDSILKDIKKSDQNFDNRKNVYYAPSFLEIVYDLLHLLPLWTGVMINQWNKRFSMKFNFPTRLSNNPVEAHFKIIKHSVLNNVTKVMPSMMASLFYARIQAKFIQYYAEKDKINFEKSKPSMFFENWKDKSLKPKSKKNCTVSYYSNFHDSIVDPLAKLEIKSKDGISEFIGNILIVN